MKPKCDGSMTCIKGPRPSPEARWLADQMAKLDPAEVARLMDRFREVLGVSKGKYVGTEQPVARWAPPVPPPVPEVEPEK